MRLLGVLFYTIQYLSQAENLWMVGLLVILTKFLKTWSCLKYVDLGNLHF